jgi:hypothetical protein
MTKYGDGAISEELSLLILRKRVEAYWQNAYPTPKPPPRHSWTSRANFRVLVFRKSFAKRKFRNCQA